MDDELLEQMDDTASEDADQAARAGIGRLLGPAFASAGKLLWIMGSIIGGDRVAGDSPFAFGSDATVGVAVLAQVAGELTAGTVSLLERDNHYAAMALVRQLVEVEYLMWAFAEDQVEAETWLRSTKDKRLSRWQPRHLCKRSHGRFRGEDYGEHCELGGHPTPRARQLLPDHSIRIPSSWCWIELALHAASTWDYLTAAVHVLGHGDWYAEHVIDKVADGELPTTLARWRASDRLLVTRLHLPSQTR